MTILCCGFDVATLLTVAVNLIICASTFGFGAEGFFSATSRSEPKRNKHPIYYIPHVHLKIDFPT